jgi:UDP-N-acetylglucosamine 2-epimerase (non-hydrolysing)
VDLGVVKVIGVEIKRIVCYASELLENKSVYDGMARGVNPYGDGKASRRIVERILKEYE